MLKNLDEKNLKKNLLKLKHEKDLYKIISSYVKHRSSSFSIRLSFLSSFTKPINIFFEKVQINDKNILLKTNRLCLLSYLMKNIIQVADFSKIIKGKEL